MQPSSGPSTPPGSKATLGLHRGGEAALREGVAKAAAAQAAAAAAAQAAARAKRKGPAAAGGGAGGAAGGGAPNLMYQVKEVLRLLQEADGHPRSFQELAEQLPFDFSPGGQLHTALHSNSNVAVSGGMLSYKSEHGIRSKAELLRYIRAHPSGVTARRVRDAYRGVMEDAEKLRAEGSVFKFWNSEVADDVYFAADERHKVTIQPEVVSLFLETRPPEEPGELIAAVERLGQRSALKNVERKIKVALPEKEKKARKRRQQAPRTVTNVHMPELFAGAAPETIDS